jgi:hypothetical protein
MEIVRKRLTPDELQSPRIRYNPVTGEVEQTNDGGVTWVPAPSQDPRLIYQQPPVATANPRCDAAARMAALLQEHIELQIANVDEGATQIFLANTLVSAASFAFGITIVFPLILTFVGTILGLGSVALHEAFDGYDWDALKCKIYCLVSTDGRLNQAGLDALYEFLLEGTVTQNLVLGGTLAYMGYGVLSDAAALRSEAGNCSSCACSWDHHMTPENTQDIRFLYTDIKNCVGQTIQGSAPGEIAVSEDPAHPGLCWRFTPIGAVANVHIGGVLVVPSDSIVVACHIVELAWLVPLGPVTFNYRVNGFAICAEGVGASPVGDRAIFDAQSLSGLTLSFDLALAGGDSSTTRGISSIHFSGTGRNPFL